MTVGPRPSKRLAETSSVMCGQRGDIFGVERREERASAVGWTDELQRTLCIGVGHFIPLGVGWADFRM
jgi:hypothetical protein